MFLVGESSIGFTQFLCQMRCSVLEGQIICQVCISNNDLHKIKFCNVLLVSNKESDMHLKHYPEADRYLPQWEAPYFM